SMLLHPVVHLHIFNSAGDILLQKRSARKDIQPNKWDTSVGGHIDLGESVDIALKRETAEELGLTDFEPKQLYQYLFKSSVEHELVTTFSTTIDSIEQITFDPEEIDEVRFWSIEEIKANLGSEILTENFKLEFNKLQSYETE
ncbi:MAG: NUDIX domain-containing protein, partial [Bacteroidales bacterium]